MCIMCMSIKKQQKKKKREYDCGFDFFFQYLEFKKIRESYKVMSTYL